MALSKKTLQLKREKKKKKRPHKVVYVSSSPLTYSHWPLYECWMPKGLWETGIGQVIVSRKNDQGEVATGLYLLDVYCLGIKDCFVRLVYLTAYEDLKNQLRERCGELELVDPVYANTLIHKVAAYAEQFGFQPHPDFTKAKHLLKNIPLDEEQKFTFGHEGKPYYMQGPHESPKEARRILNTLTLKAGQDNYHFTVEVPDDYSLDPLEDGS